MIAAVALCAAPAVAADDAAIGWTGEASAAIAVGTGTTRTFSGNVDGKATRTWENDVASIRARADYGLSEESRDASQKSIQNSQALLADWKHTIHERFFWDTNAELSRDVIQDREVRARVNTGPGYRWWESEDAAKQHFDTSFGVGYRYELYDGNTGSFNAGLAADNGFDENFVDLVLGWEYRNLLFDDSIEYTHTGFAAMPANDPDAYLLRTEVIIGIPLTEAWSFRIAALVEYTNEVPNEVEKLRTNTTLGLGYKF